MRGSLTKAVAAALRDEEEGYRILYAICRTDGSAVLHARYPELEPQARADLVQEAAVRAFDKLRALRDPEKFRSWYLVTVLRLAAREARRRSKERTLVAAYVRELPPSDPAASIRRDVERQVVREAIEGIRTSQRREVARLHYVEGVTRTQIAERLGLSEDQVRSQLYRLRKEVRGRIVRRLLLLHDRLLPLAATREGGEHGT